MMLATKQQHDTIDDFARSLEPRVRRIFLQAVERLRGSVGLAMLEAAIRSGSMGAVQDALGIERLAAELIPFRSLILDAVIGGGEIAAAEVGLGIAFDITDERALRYVRQYSGRLITGITEETRAGIVRLLEYQFEVGRAPRETARLIRSRIGLTAGQEAIAQNYETTLRAAVRGEATWAEVSRYRLNPIRGPGGLVEARVDAAVERFRARLLAHRADTIARTETLAAANAGQEELWKQLQDRGAIPLTQLREWMTAEDERTCPQCAPLDGERVGLDQPFSDGTLAPPRHPRCRCTTALYFPDEDR